MDKLIYNLIEKKITEIFCEVQDKFGITSGDVLPEHELELDETKEKLSKIIKNIIEFELETNGIKE